MSYPSTIDSFSTKNTGDTIQAVDVNNPQTAIVSIETKLGIDSSAVTSTIDYLLKNPASISPGHLHHAADIVDAGAFVTTGSLLEFAGSSVPSGFTTADGSAVSRTTFASLFSAIGTTYGSGNGITTFNLPNLYWNNSGIIVRDANSQGASSGALTTTVAHTCNGANRILLVGINCQDGDNVTGVTYAGIAMTQLKKQAQGGQEAYVYGLLNPITGTNNIIATRSTNTNSLDVCGASYKNVSQINFPDASGSNSSASTTSLATTLTTIRDRCWTFLVASNGGAGTITAGSGSSLVTQTSNGGTLSVFDSNSPITPAGSAAMTVTQSAHVLQTAMISFAPVVVATNLLIKT